MNQENKKLTIKYKNYKGEIADRNIIPKELWFGATQWHPKEQWLLKAQDLDKNEERDFALVDIISINSVDVENNTSESTDKNASQSLLAQGASEDSKGAVQAGTVTADRSLQHSDNDESISGVSSSANKLANALRELSEVKLYTDGGSRGNPGPSASAYVIQDMDGNELESDGLFIGITTNNQAEYQALRRGLERLLQLNAKTVHVFMDSELVVKQMRGEYKVKNRDLWPIYESLVELSKKFKKVHFNHVPRELNKQADSEVNRILDEQENGYNK